jgi:hypothetical protein
MPCEVAVYQAFPGSGEDRERDAPVPQSVRRAVWFMYARAVASIISVGIDAVAINWFKIRMHQMNNGLTSAELTTIVHVAIGAIIAIGLISTALWIWIALSCRAGKSWARITATVLFVINTIFTLSGLANGSVSTSTSTSTTTGGITTTASNSTVIAFGAFNIVAWLIGLGAIIFLWQRSSSAYFNRPPNSWYYRN